MRMLKNLYTLLLAVLVLSVYSCKQQDVLNEVAASETVSSTAVTSGEDELADTYVLVHGAWHPEESWHLVKDGLEKAGNTVVTVQLPGLGRDTTPAKDVDFASHVDAVKKAVVALGRPVILVGHSYGGTVISQVGEDIAPLIKKLVYVTAFLPQDGQNQVELSSGDPVSTAAQYFIFNEHDFVVQDDKIEEVFYTNVLKTEDPKYDALVKNIRPLLKPHPLGTMFTPLSLKTNFKSLNKVYISCLQDNAISAEFQKIMYSHYPETKVYTIPTADHSPFFSTPNLLINILKRL